MFIDRSVNPLPNPFGGAEIQLELHPYRNFPLLRTEPVGGVAHFYKHVTPSGVKPYAVQRTR